MKNVWSAFFISPFGPPLLAVSTPTPPYSSFNSFNKPVGEAFIISGTANEGFLNPDKLGVSFCFETAAVISKSVKANPPLLKPIKPPRAALDLLNFLALALALTSLPPLVNWPLATFAFDTSLVA